MAQDTALVAARAIAEDVRGIGSMNANWVGALGMGASSALSAAQKLQRSAAVLAQILGSHGSEVRALQSLAEVTGDLQTVRVMNLLNDAELETYLDRLDALKQLINAEKS